MKDVGQCITCKCQVWIPNALHEAAHAAAGKLSFYCSYGHEMVFSRGESELDKIRRERDRLTQRLAEKDDEITRQRERTDAAERRRAAAQGQVTKIKNRVGNGVCPCCNRTFQNLANHMAHQHPTFTAEAAE